MAESTACAPSEFIVGEKYRLVRRIASGVFGVVYLGVDITNNEEVAVKLENIKSQHLLLLNERNMYAILQGGIGIPNIRWYGQKRDFNVLVMDRLGPSLQDIFNVCSGQFTIKTVLMLAPKMIRKLEYIHTKNVIHRDIKPENFLMGAEGNDDWNELYLIDFGLSKEYRDSRTLCHIPFKQDKYLIGTLRYSSIRATRGIEQSRRDDMESLGYVLMYFNRGNLPWVGLEAQTDKQKLEKLRLMKMSTSVELLCEGYPPEFAVYLNYCRGLGFEEVPDYMYLCQLFRTLLRTLHHQDDNLFDWIILLKQKKVLPTIAGISQTQAQIWLQAINAASEDGNLHAPGCE